MDYRADEPHPCHAAYIDAGSPHDPEAYMADCINMVPPDYIAEVMILFDCTAERAKELLIRDVIADSFPIIAVVSPLNDQQFIYPGLETNGLGLTKQQIYNELANNNWDVDNVVVWIDLRQEELLRQREEEEELLRQREEEEEWLRQREEDELFRQREEDELFRQRELLSPLTEDDKEALITDVCQNVNRLIDNGCTPTDRYHIQDILNHNNYDVNYTINKMEAEDEEEEEDEEEAEPNLFLIPK